MDVLNQLFSQKLLLQSQGATGLFGSIKIMFFSYARGIRSSRKIEEMAFENIVFRYLSANQQPDHGTINLFRKTHLENLENIFTQIVRLCDGLKIIDPTDISIDGSIFRASASKKATHDQEEIDKLKKKIRKMLEEAEEIDKQEDEEYGKEHGYNEMPEKFKDPKTRQKEIKRLTEKLNKLETAEQTIKEKQQAAKTKKEKDRKRNTTYNTTDPDANLMKLKIGKAYKPAYNGQIATNNQIILAYEPVFGNIACNQKANNFLCRGKPKVKIEFGLACIAHNLVKISNWIKKEKKEIKNLQLDALMRLPATA